MSYDDSCLFTYYPNSNFFTILTRSDSTLDVTESLFGSTIYIESTQFPGWWIGSTDHHNGHLFEESEKSVFNPSHPCRIHVIDCGSGWACLRTRYQEDETRNVGNVYSSRDPASRLEKDPRSWYLKADWLGVDFSHNTASPADKGSEFRWRIKCQSSPVLDLNMCYLESGHYHEGRQLYAHATKSLDTKFREDGDDDSRFRHRVMRPEFSQLSQEGEVVGETCNHSEQVIEAEFSFTEGISVDASFGMSFGVSASEEIYAGCTTAHAGETISASWGAEMSTSSTWEKSKTTTIRMLVPPMTCMTITKLTGVYGTPFLTPYTIGTHNYNVYQHSADFLKKY